MRIKLSRHYWFLLRIMFGVGIVIEMNLLYSIIGTSREDLFWGISLMVIYALIITSVALMPWKYLMTMTINGNIMQSFLFGKLRCEIDTNKVVYYAIFKCLETNTNKKNYIAISNEVFCYEERKATLWSRNTYIDCYDRTKQIIFPYDEKTKQLFPIEKWICVN